MVRIRKADERGRFNHGWLDTRHTFSFGEYFDAANIQFRSLRVMNEDRIAPGAGFPLHGHRDMEIITYVLSGALQHRDSLGHLSLVRAGELQRMTAGTGIQHSESNPSATDELHLYQIWILPERGALEPEYEQRMFPVEAATGRPRLVISPDGHDGSMRIHQDARIYLARIAEGGRLTHELDRGRHAWLQVLRGDVAIDSHGLTAGDGAALSDERSLGILAQTDAEVMLLDLA
ncbi:MAG: pirin family protein [Planctomycetia bacterium]|nr:pirin family protein [Planctomycetia bacterium]